MNEQGRNQQSPTQLTLLYKELKKQPHIETHRDRETEKDTHTHKMTRMRDKKSLREREIEDTKPQKARASELSKS
jgi:hypothetical protein